MGLCVVLTSERGGEARSCCMTEVRLLTIACGGASTRPGLMARLSHLSPSRMHACFQNASLLPLFCAAGFAVLAGCATRDPDNVRPPKPGSGVKEYAALVAEAESDIQGSLRCLENIRAQKGRCRPGLVRDLGDEVDRLHVDSIRVRARVQVIQARGDAYLEAWTNNAGLMRESPLRLSPESLPQIQEAFSRIKQKSQQTGDVFRPYFAGLRKLRVELEKDPGANQTEQGQQLIQTMREEGVEVLRNLRALGDELQSFERLLATAKAAGNS